MTFQHPWPNRCQQLRRIVFFGLESLSVCGYGRRAGLFFFEGRFQDAHEIPVGAVGFWATVPPPTVAQFKKKAGLVASPDPIILCLQEWDRASLGFTGSLL